MGIRKTQFAEGEYYHIYNRGNSKQKIFLSDEDYDRFIKLLYLCNSMKRVNFRDEILAKKINAFDFERGEQIISIGAWVLMPNHFHLYITIPQGLSFVDEKEKINMISLFMNKLCTSYSMYFNKKYARTGALFEGKFRSVHIANDNQAKYLFSYIHLNPIKLIDPKWKEGEIKSVKESLDFLDKYKWSSYLDYKNKLREENVVLNREFFQGYFSNILDFDKEILDWLKIKNS
jgi:putative transposase